jgi:hypothetical protein
MVGSLIQMAIAAPYTLLGSLPLYEKIGQKPKRRPRSMAVMLSAGNNAAAKHELTKRPEAYALSTIIVVTRLILD